MKKNNTTTQTTLALLAGCFLLNAPSFAMPISSDETTRTLSMGKVRKQLKSVERQEGLDRVERLLETAARVFNRDNNTTETLVRENLIANPRKRMGVLKYDLIERLDDKPIRVSELNGVELHIEGQLRVGYSRGQLDYLVINLSDDEAWVVLWGKNGEIRSESIQKAPQSYGYEKVGDFSWPAIPAELTPGEFDKDDNAAFFNDCLVKINEYRTLVEAAKTTIRYNEFKNIHWGGIELNDGSTITFGVPDSTKKVLTLTVMGPSGRFTIDFLDDGMRVSQLDEKNANIYFFKCDPTGKVTAFFDNRPK